MAEATCEYCDHVFTDQEVDEGESHTALAKVELRCPMCGAHNQIDFRDLVDRVMGDEPE